MHMYEDNRQMRGCYDHFSEPGCSPVFEVAWDGTPLHRLRAKEPLKKSGTKIEGHDFFRGPLSRAMRNGTTATMTSCLQSSTNDGMLRSYRLSRKLAACQ